MKARLPDGVQMKRSEMMQQLQKMQQQMEETQTQVEESTFTAAAGGGMVTAEVNGKKEVLKITIDPEVVDPEDVEMLEDLVCAAVNEALAAAGKAMDEQMGQITGNLPMSGLSGIMG